MENDTVLKVEGLYKKFCRSIKRSMAYGTIDMMRNFIGVPSDHSKLRKDEFWALQDINFELKKGEALGLIGKNGSGKSTLLRLISGIFPPDQGKIMKKGRVGSLIAIGAGFHPHMTGKENIYLNGTILGMKKSQINEKFNEIIEFADIGEFLDAPVSTYSSGMRVRLGFSIAIHSIPNILLIDEVLAVGDMEFKQKCMSKLSEILENGTSLILVSHQTSYIQNICNKTILLHKGKIIKSGKSLDVISKYNMMNADPKYLLNEIKNKKIISSYGISLNYINFFNEQGKKINSFFSGEDLIVEWNFNIPKPLYDVALTFSMSDGLYTYNGYITQFDNVEVKKLTNDTIIKIKLKKVFLSPGNYSISIGIWDKNLLKAYFWDYENTGNIEVNYSKKMQSKFEFQHKWEIK